jgi:hypothetical protein
MMTRDFQPKPAYHALQKALLETNAEPTKAPAQ